MTNEETFRRYEAMFIAERAWEKQLSAKFGDDASQARYEKRGEGQEGDALRLAYIARDKALRHYFAAVDELRLDAMATA